MQKIKSGIGHIVVFGILTLFTQTGGVIWLMYLPLYYWVNKKNTPAVQRVLLKTVSFSVLYLLVNFFLVPPLAKWQSGRVPLPVLGNQYLRPQQVFYFALLNHHYVRPEVKESCERVAGKLAAKFLGTQIHYLDANFPFFDGYPLQPHYTHRNGTTVDIALHWTDTKTGRPISGAPTPLAYGASAAPLPGEVDMEAECGNRFRSLEMRVVNRFYKKEAYRLDEKRTAELVRLFSMDKAVRKILIEPHLKTRLGLSKYDNLRFQGCKAARHDDHIHVIW